jgi:SAM-dependent MidA family methyltransferase
MRPLIDLIRREIAGSGVLSFARFMELALYCPVYGYYEAKTDNPGRRGDFFTSVSVGELFGQLLACQFAEWLEPEVRSQKSEVRIIEAGAHDGTLARDILNWLQLARPKLFEQIEYDIIEPSVRRQAWQREKLEQFAPHVRWFTDFKTLSRVTRHPSLHGVIFSNELLDAMPAHRLGWDAAAKKWFEWGVALEGEKFVWARCADSLAPHSGERAGARGFDPSSALNFLARRSEAEMAPSELLAVLPDGYTVEISPAAQNWWHEAAGVLGRGRLMTIDYGLDADELFSPSRPRGTLRAYFRQHVADDLLANAGEQDLTAHVNFAAIQAAGESAGLTTENFSTQAQFLTRILEKAVKDKSFGELVASKPLVSPKSDGGGSGDGWTASRTRQFQTLTHPEHLGRAFRVLVQLK